ncbi:hypothetical protein K501DRAFT_315026 [Backusella circina FSU 941]|nr:hypothetical protein K501DRAFT_315026 [Backusella circina FSU 941]
MEIMPTIVQWLTWIKEKRHLNVKRIMVDCSATEIGAIKSVFGNQVNVLLCHWHIWRAWEKNMKKEVKVANATKETKIVHERIRSLLSRMMHAPSEEEFFVGYNCLKTFVEVEYSSFLTYFDKQWIMYLCQDASFHTNNLIESYHNQLKSFYLGRSRNVSVDRLVYVLSEIVTIDYRQESIQNVWYNIQREDHFIYACDCPDVSPICKHIFLVSRIHGIPYTIVKNLSHINNIENTDEEEAAYKEIVQEEDEIRLEELQDTRNNLEKLLLKELHHPIQSFYNTEQKISHLELLNHNMKSFISTLRSSRTPHQARPERQS